MTTEGLSYTSGTEDCVTACMPIIWLGTSIVPCPFAYLPLENYSVSTKKQTLYRTPFEHLQPEWRRPIHAPTQTNKWSISDVRTKVIRRGKALHNQETPETAGNKVNVQESKQNTHTHTHPDFTQSIFTEIPFKNFCGLQLTWESQCGETCHTY